MYNNICKAGENKISLRKEVRKVNEMNVTEALLKAILELIEKCRTLEELRESVKRIMKDQ